MRLKSLVMVMTFTVCLYSSVAVNAQTPIPACPGAPAPRLVVGSDAQIAPGSPSNLRNQPGKSGTILNQLFAGDFVLVVGGPVCADGYLWWNIDRFGQLKGWVAEGGGSDYYLLPTTSQITRFERPAGADKIDVGWNNVLLSYNGVFGDKLNARTVFDRKLSDANPFVDEPEHAYFQFGNVDPAQPYLTPELSIYKVADLQTRNENTPAVVADLTKLLQGKADPTKVARIPVFPFVNAGQIFHVKNALIKTANGSGVRFVSMYAQALVPVTNENISYYFQGITSDGKYYLSLRVPIKTSALEGNDKLFPDMNDPNIQGSFEAYMQQSRQKIESAPPRSFSPALDAVDAFITGITVK